MRGGGLLKVLTKRTWVYNKHGKSRFLFWFVIVLRIVIKKKINVINLLKKQLPNS